MEGTKRVAIVGAGSSGITAAKCLLDDGHDVRVFEQTDQIGGNWVFRKDSSHSSVYKSTFINTSRQLMCYSDFPMPDHLPDYPHHTHIVEYFNRYAEHFGVTKRVEFETTVQQIEPSGERWDVTFDSEEGSRTDRFDAVVIANGHHWSPRWPDFPGMDSYQGRVIHSHDYKQPNDLADRQVVVVGFGNSAVDIACETSRVAQRVYLSTRRGAWVVPKYAYGRPLDHIGVTRLNKLVPYFLKRRLLKLLVDVYQGDISRFGLPKPSFGILQAHPTVSGELLDRLGHGTISIRPNISKFQEDSIAFEDGTVVQADVVVLCTGYNISFPFLSHEILRVRDNRVELYKRIFLPDRPNLAFIGLCQPLGALMPLAEMQARWFSKILLGESGLPPRETMNQEIKRESEKLRERYVGSPRHTIQVDFLEYMDDIASEIGAKPRLWRHPSLIPALLFGPATPIQYRLDGPGQWEPAAREIQKVYRQTRTKKNRRSGQFM